MVKITSFFLLITLLVFPLRMAYAQTAEGFRQWTQEFQTRALAEGIAPTTLQKTIPQLTFEQTVVDLDRKQPEHRITFAAYLNRTLPDSRIRRARQLMETHKELLNEIGARYGVDPRVIVALWGKESSFGANTGGFSVLDSLATLAYEGRRAAFFEGELIHALRIIEEEGLDPFDLEGSWAGAMGQSQFMPSTYRNFAVDYDGDGKRDIWGSQADVFASIAHYLSAEGWRPGFRWGREVRLTSPQASQYVGLTHSYNLAFWQSMGVRTQQGGPLPTVDIKAHLVQPDGAGGRSFLVYDNFLALMKWNRSTYFATTVGLFIDALE